MKKRVQKNKKGISLIVLVITIIVIIILAVAVILSISNNNPIENARKARFQNDLKTIQEEVSLYVGKQYVDNNGTYKLEDCSFSGSDMLDKFESIPEDYKDKIEISNGKIVLIENGLSDQENEWAREIGIDIKESYPVMPKGFSYLEGTVDTGYVIVNNTDGNEFVWVPVEVSEGKTFEETFIREDGYAKNTLQYMVSNNETKEPLETGDLIESAEYEEMVECVKKYGGFYIGRYETSNNENNVFESKKDKEPHYYYTWEKTVEKIRAIYPNSDKLENSKYAVSTLIYGVQWDATVRWLGKNYPNISRMPTGYGNYAPSLVKFGTKINTGSVEDYKTNNIYDMCGNVKEWTMEAKDEKNRITRGGTYQDLDYYCPISFRESCLANTSGYMASRIALYVK